MKNFLIWKIPHFVFLFVIIILLIGCGNDEQPIDVSVQKISHDINTIFFNGKISLSASTEIPTKIKGTIVEIYFKNSQSIEVGQPLFKVGDRDKESELLQCRADIGSAKAAVTQATSELKQVELALKQGVGAAKDLEDKRILLQERRRELAQLQIHCEELTNETALGIVNAPISGQVFANFPLGANVEAGDIIATIGKFNPVTVKFDINSDEKNFLSSHELKVSLQLNDGEIIRGGSLNIGENVAEAIFDNSDNKLMIGNDANIQIESLKIPNTIIIPENKILHQHNENFVYIVDSDKKICLKKIILGSKIGNCVVVRDGLQVDDLLVIDNSTNFHEGQPVNIRSD